MKKLKGTISFDADLLDNLRNKDTIGILLAHKLEKESYFNKIKPFEEFGIHAPSKYEAKREGDFAIWINLSKAFSCYLNGDWSVISEKLHQVFDKEVQFKNLTYYKHDNNDNYLFDEFEPSISFSNMDSDIENILHDMKLIVDTLAKFEIVPPTNIGLKLKGE